jgi:hypothetical protein
MRKTWLVLVSGALLALAGCAEDNAGGGGGGASPKATGDSNVVNASIETSKTGSPAQSPATAPAPEPSRQGVGSGVAESRDP